MVGPVVIRRTIGGGTRGGREAGITITGRSNCSTANVSLVAIGADTALRKNGRWVDCGVASDDWGREGTERVWVNVLGESTSRFSRPRNRLLSFFFNVVKSIVYDVMYSVLLIREIVKSCKREIVKVRKVVDKKWSAMWSRLHYICFMIHNTVKGLDIRSLLRPIGNYVNRLSSC